MVGGAPPCAVYGSRDRLLSAGGTRERVRPVRKIQQDEGQTLVEYVLVTGLVSVALVATLGALAGGLGQLFDTIVAQF